MLILSSIVGRIDQGNISQDYWMLCMVTLGKKATIHQVTTMLATSKNVLVPGPNHLLTTGADDPSLEWQASNN